jgi:flagellar hook assembly protein FlgD
VLDARGRVVRTLVDGPLAAGAAVYAWDGRRNDGTRTAAGLYFARLERAGVAVESRRFVRVD